MKIDVQSHGTVAVVVPHGPLTRDELGDFRATVDETVSAKEGRVVLDMTQVPFVDSGGIETLLDICGTVDAFNRPRLAQLDETCREALALTDVLTHLDVFDTVDNAIRSYKQ